MVAYLETENITDSTNSAWNGATLVGLALTYFPHKIARIDGLSRMAVLKRIDYMGGFLSITGIVLLLVALQAGGNTQ